MPMKKSLTIVFMTGRLDPEIEWFYDSLEKAQRGPDDNIQVLIVDFHREGRDLASRRPSRSVAPKPTIWQGPHRVTKGHHWAVSNSRNTAFALCKTEWIAFVDDRSLLAPTYLDAINRAMENPVVLCGTYQKRSGMKVRAGEIVDQGFITGEDSRRKHSPKGLPNAPGGWLFGANFALPLEWALDVNGFEEALDGLSMEDSIFGLMLKNQKRPLTFDPELAIIEDRTPSQLRCGLGIARLEDDVFIRRDKGTSPNDKSHAALRRFGTRHATDPEWTPNLRDVRRDLAHGLPFRVPPERAYHDWYDNSIINGLE
jgi:hypothetical protein